MNEGKEINKAQEIINKLINENCFSKSKLMVFPDWLTNEDIEFLIQEKIIIRKNRGPDTYSHSDYYLNITL